MAAPPRSSLTTSAPGATGMGTTTSTGAPRRDGSITLHVYPTTGGNFAVDVHAGASIDELKGRIARQLRLPKERLSLLFKETHLRRGSLFENGIVNGCKLTLLPVVESGITSQRQEDKTLLQALQNLTEAQVDNFLNGKQPLTLALRLGNHMVFVQLQLAGTPTTGGNPQSLPQQPSRHPPHQRVNTSTQTSCRVQRARSVSTSSMPTATAATSPRPVTPPCIVMPTPPTGCPRSQCPVHGSLSTAAAENKPRPQLHHQPRYQYHQPHCQRQTAAPSSPPASPTTPSSPTSPNTRHHHHQCPPRSGAYIESVEQHSPGIFSGTFSGILGTAVQDQQGRTRRDISTIAHIMNDLLQAAPFYKQHASPLCCNRHRGTTRHRVEAAGGRASRGVTQPQEKPMRYPSNHQPQDYRQQHVENDHTRSKMAHLQTMMRERHARRQARRSMYGPYSIPQHLHHGSAKAAALSMPENSTTDCSGGNKERAAMTDNCYPSLKQDYLAV